MNDIHSFAKPHQISHSHLHLSLQVDFSRKIISGTALFSLNRLAPGDEFVLDTRKLQIKSVTDENGRPLRFDLGEEIEHLGQALNIVVGDKVQKVQVEYETSPDADALQWLAPQQTLGKTLPFLFTQSQAILARTWVPCQDGPGVKFTYTATVKVPSGMMALMSASNSKQLAPDGIYHFEMKKPISSYLLALAVGDLTFQELGPECGVYAERQMLDRAAWEFADLQAMIDAAGELYGKYLWGRYDVLVLPPSFPFGGMENPVLTFATPTIIAGDRSLVALVAHELAHSWSGNLVTNATWNDFWLNEGFTVYFEHRIMEHIYGKNYADMLAVLGYNELLNTLNDMGYDNPDTRLRIDLGGRNPDDGVTDIAYEKGRSFLTTIEQFTGREEWDAFVKDYFSTFAFQAMTTDKFLGYLSSALLDKYPGAFEKLKIQEWIDYPGLPDNCFTPHSAIFEDLANLTDKWLADKNDVAIIDTIGWTTHHWNFFLRRIANKVNHYDVQRLDNAFNLTQKENAEIACDWLLICVKTGYSQAYGRLEQFLIDVGRRKFLKPLYEQMAATPATLALAKNIYAKARPGYHSVSIRTIDEILNWRL